MKKQEKKYIKMLLKIDENVSKCFFVKKVLIVEGDTEQVVLMETINRMKRDDNEWKFFVESLWDIQGLKKIAELTDEIMEVFYDECQGITAVAVNLFILAQERALQENKEEITIDIVRKTAQND